MTKQQAVKWVKSHNDEDDMDADDLERAFEAIFDRSADNVDRSQGLWSHLCQAVKD